MSTLKVYSQKLSDILWQYIQDNQDDSCASIGRIFELTEEQARHLILRWGMGDRGGFNEEYKEILKPK